MRSSRRLDLKCQEIKLASAVRGDVFASSIVRQKIRQCSVSNRRGGSNQGESVGGYRDSAAVAQSSRKELQDVFGIAKRWRK
jgi:hypothetical protein